MAFTNSVVVELSATITAWSSIVVASELAAGGSRKVLLSLLKHMKIKRILVLVTTKFERLMTFMLMLNCLVSAGLCHTDSGMNLMRVR